VPYVVEVLVEAGHPVWFCSCPAAAEGALCKHAVATALALVGTTGTQPVPPTQRRGGSGSCGGDAIAEAVEALIADCAQLIAAARAAGRCRRVPRHGTPPTRT
jgi:hypothetical protein